MFKTIYKDTPEVNAAYFVLTEQCNLRCTYCYEQHGTKRMTLEVAKAGVDLLFKTKHNNVSVTFFGGEPTLECKLIIEIVEYIKEINEKLGKQVTLGMVTNCTMMPADFYDYVTTIPYNFNVQLSVDGPEKIQDMYRVKPGGSGSWYLVDKVLDKWKKLRDESNTRISLHGCINIKTLPHLFDTYKYFRERREIERLWFIPVSEEPWTEEHVDLYRDQLRKIKDYVIQRCLLENRTDELSNYAPLDRCLNNYSTRGKPCAAGNNFVSVTPEGTLSPCHQIYFNTPNSEIGDVWEGVDDHKRRLFLEYDDSDFPCGDCPHTTCFRCIAHNLDNRGCMFSNSGEIYCKMMLVDMEIQDELKVFMEGLEGGTNK